MSLPRLRRVKQTGSFLPGMGSAVGAATRLYLAIGLALAPFSSAAAATTAKPNIILIMVDDLDNLTMSTALAQGLMPNMQKYIVNTGTTFTNSFVSNGHGCPSRGTLFTGQYFHNYQGSTAKCGVSVFNDSSTMATWLHNGGYRTALIGRYLDGYGYTDINHDGIVNSLDQTYIPPGWDNWQAFVFPTFPPPQGIVAWYENANMYDYYINDNGIIAFYGTQSQSYQVDVISGRAANYLTNVAPASTAPFFLMVAPTAPHVEVFPDPTMISSYQEAWTWDIRPPARYAGTVSLSLPQPPNFNESDVSDKPLWVQAWPPLTSTDITNVTRQWNDRLASMRAVDDLIGNIFQNLSKIGKTSSTLVLFTSDNGWMYGPHRLSNKMALYDEAAQVPLYATNSQGTAGSTAGMVTNVDLTATILKAAGIAPGLPADGVSFLPLMSQRSQPWRNRFLLENWESTAANGQPGVFSVPTYAAVRAAQSAASTPNQVYGHYTDGEFEFYDLEADPYALQNQALSTSPQYVQQRNLLHQQLGNLRACGNGTCQTFEFQP